MTAARASISIGAMLLAGTFVFSPIAAALFGTGVNGAALSLAFRSAGPPLAKTAAAAIAAAMIALLLGAPFALLTERMRPTFRRLLWAAALLNLMVPPYLVAEAAIVLFGPAGFVSRGVALLLGFGPHITDPITLARFAVPGFVYTWPAVGVVMGGCLFPIVALAVASADRRTDRRMFEAARITRGPHGVMHIAAHALVPPAVGAALLVFAITLTEFAVPQVLRLHTINESMYERIQEGDLATAAALSLPLLPIIIAAGAAGAFILYRSRVASMAGLEGDVPRFQSRRASMRMTALTCIAAVIAILPALICPIVSLFWLVAAAKLPAASALGTHKVLRAAGFLDSLNGAWGLARDDAVRTVLLASVAATVATLFAIALARLVVRSRLGTLLGVLGAGLAVPAPIVGLGLIVLWNHDATIGVYQNPIIVLLAWLARFLPVAVFLAQAALARVPHELESAAALTGRGRIGRLAAVVLPGAAPGLAAAWLALYVLCATEFSATLLVAPPGQSLLAPSIVNLMRRGQDPEIAACQVLLLAVVALPLVPLALGTLYRARRGSRATR